MMKSYLVLHLPQCHTVEVVCLSDVSLNSWKYWKSPGILSLLMENL